MIFLLYIIACVLAYVGYWYFGSLLIGLPGMGMTVLLVKIMPKLKGVFGKILLFPIIFVTYLLNNTLYAFTWAIVVTIITLPPMSDVSHPWLYFLLGCFASFSIGAPSGESDFFVSLQCFLMYAFFTAGQFTDMYEKGMIHHYSNIYRYVWIISGFIVIAVIVVSFVFVLIQMISMADEDQLCAEVFQFRKRKQKQEVEFGE